MKLPKEYYDQIRDLSRVARKWMEEHPDVDAKVQFNYPEGVFLCAVPEDAIEKGMVTCNENGRELLKAMGAFGDNVTGPSISMIKFALEYLEEIRKEDNGNTR